MSFFRRLLASGDSTEILRDWRERTLNKAYRLGAVLLGIGIAVVYFTDIKKYPGQTMPLVIYSAIFCITVTTASLPRLNYRLKGWVLLGIIQSFALLALLRSGLTGVGRVFLVTMPIIAVVLLGRTAAIIATIVSAFTLLTLAFLARNNSLEPFYLQALSSDPFNFQFWLTEAIYTLIIMALVLFLIDQFYQIHLRKLKAEQEHSQKLNETKELLEASNQSLEEKVRQRTSELAAITQEAQQARVAAETASRAKSAFLETTSHEIRTPLNAILEMTGLLSDTPLTVQQSEFIETIHSSGEELLSLVNNILDFSSLEVTRIELEKTPIALRGYIESIVDVIASEASNKNISILISIDSNVPAVIIGDETRLRQVISIFLNNAVKFTDKGEVEISITSERIPSNRVDLETGSNLDRLIFAIRDTGIGIPENQKEAIFQPFSQGNLSSTRKYSASNLGLVIAKQLIKMMNGSVWFESQVGVGTTFYFTLEARPAIGAEGNSNIEARLSLRDKRVLIIDERATDRRVLTLQFQAWNMQPCAAASTEEALQWIRCGEVFDLAVISMDNKEMDFADLHKEIHRLRSTRNLPVILVTESEHSIPLKYQALFFAYLRKPVKASLLHNALMPIFAGKFEKILVNNQQLPIFGTSMAAQRPLDILVIEDNLINQKLILLMLERLGYRADVAVNGLNALAAFKQKRYDAVLMNLKMPEMDGIETARRIRTEFSLQNQPRIIAMTANAMGNNCELCLQAGMDDCISKPIRVEELVNALSRCQTRKAREQNIIDHL